MNEYVKHWKAEHAAIMDFLACAVTLDIGSKAGQEKIREAKNMILKHLKSEDEVLYPMLKKDAREKVNLEKLLEIFVKEMDELAPKVLSFFKEYEDNPKAEGLSSELYRLIGLLKVRIYAEENMLIKKYEIIAGQADNEKKA